MRILFSYGLVGRGGDAIQILEIVDAFRNLGHEIELFGPQQLRPYEFTNTTGYMRNILRRLPWWAKDAMELTLNWHILTKAKDLLRRRRFDLIFHRAGIYDFVGVHLAKEANCPLIIQLDAPFAIERAYHHEGYFRQMHHRAMQNLGRIAQYVVTVSEASREYYLQLGLPAAKLIILPNGIPEYLLRKGMELSRIHPPFTKGYPLKIGFVGSLSTWHRVDLILEALLTLQSQGKTSWQLLIIGYGEEYHKLYDQAQRLGLESYVHWRGALPHQEAFEQIAEFDIAILPHTLPSGAPMKLFEYAAVARPAIVPDLPNLRKLFAEDEMVFFQSGSPNALVAAVQSLSNDPEAARQLGVRAQNRVRGNTWEYLILQLLEKFHLDT